MQPPRRRLTPRAPIELPQQERHLNREVMLQGAINFRDLGGYSGYDGRSVKWGKLYRSASLAGLTAADQRYLQQLKISHVLDLRTPDEHLKQASQLPKNIRVLNLPLSAAGANLTGMTRDLARGRTANYDLHNMLVRSNRLLATEYKAELSQIFALADDSDGAAMVFHCTAGKDRTGFTAAMWLRILGVSEQNILQDYLLTNELLKPVVARQLRQVRIISLFRADIAGIRSLLSAKARYLETAFAVIDRQFQNFDEYQQQILGVDNKRLQRLRALYLEPSDSAQAGS